MSSTDRTTATSSATGRPLHPDYGFDEHRWVIQIRRSFEEEQDDDDAGVPVSIFNVPKALIANKPDAYVPQQVAVGPYHHWRPELYEMERYKLSAAKRTQKQLRAGSLKFHHLVDHLAKLEPRIQSCYHRYLDFNGDTLAWMMAVDGCFLLEFLHVYAAKEGKALTRVSSRMSHLVDYAGTKSGHNAILRDIMMLENQIPLFLLREVLEHVNSSLGVADELLCAMLLGLCKEVSPFKMMDISHADVISSVTERPVHLLDVLYHAIVPKLEEASSEIMEEDGEDEQNESGKSTGDGVSSYTGSSIMNCINQRLDNVWGFISSMKLRPFHLLKRIIFSRPFKFILRLPWKILSSLPGFFILKQPIEYLLFGLDKNESDNAKPEDQRAGFSSDNNNYPPLIEEIMIPSVKELFDSGVTFVATTGGLSTISFDEKMATLHLPAISLDVNTEVMLRNLVAYEASAMSGPLVLTRYTELMNGIIDTEEDVRLLRKKGIVLNRLKSREVADLWNGMSKSVRLTKVPFLDKVIEDMNKYHNGRWKIRVGRFMKRYVFGSWQFLALLAAILLLLLTGLQAFCSVYTCARWFHVQN